MVVHLYRNEWEELQRAIWQLQGSSSNILNKRANQQFVDALPQLPLKVWVLTETWDSYLGLYMRIGKTNLTYMLS